MYYLAMKFTVTNLFLNKISNEADISFAFCIVFLRKGVDTSY